MDKKELFSRLDTLFFPKSIAVVGASDNPAKWGFMVMTAILGGGYKGKTFPVNPSKERILDQKVYARISDIKEQVDLAIFTIPAKFIPEAFQECIEKGITSAVLISSGFKETGEEGAKHEAEVTAIAKQGGLVFIGPNTMGIASTQNRLVAVAAPIDPQTGGLAIISQSGNLGLQIMQWTAHRGIGVGFYAGTGNEALLQTADLLEYFGVRDDVNTIALYIEGIRDGKEFMNVAREVTKKKPVVALKAGRSKTGSKAARSHSGSMAGSFATYSAMFKQTGICQVRTPSELLNVAGAMSYLPIPKSNRVGIMSLGGGWGIIAADECEDLGLLLPDLPQNLIEEISKKLPGFWNKSNPIDMVGEADPNVHLHVMKLLAQWDEIDSIIALGMVGRAGYVEDFISSQERIDGTLFSRELKLSLLKDQMKSEMRILTEMAKLQKDTGKTLIAVSLSEGEQQSIVDTDYGKVFKLFTPEEAVNIIAHMVRYRDYIEQSG